MLGYLSPSSCMVVNFVIIATTTTSKTITITTTTMTTRPRHTGWMDGWMDGCIQQSARMVDTCFAMGSRDNMSVLLVDLNSSFKLGPKPVCVVCFVLSNSLCAPVGVASHTHTMPALRRVDLPSAAPARRPCQRSAIIICFCGLVRCLPLLAQLHARTRARCRPTGARVRVHQPP